ncbi:MAG: glycosyltransferase family 4 protein [Desulfobacterales bacterium]
MRIYFYAPFKPLGHPNPSGDLITAQGLVAFLRGRGHGVQPISDLRARWIYFKPWDWPVLWAAARRIQRQGKQNPPHLWLTYHTYYKAPDLLGPEAAQSLNIPYVIFQGMYATKRRRNWRTWPGYKLNRRALTCAQAIFSNRRMDLNNLARLIPCSRLTYVRPGIDVTRFQHDADARKTLRARWGVGDRPVILAAAMFRPDVKSEGIRWVIETCRHLRNQRCHFFLVLVGDGQEGQKLRRLARDRIPGQYRFVGQVSREELYRYYSAADLFVFPGIRESLGMVYLEAQACGLPVVAFDNAGVPEVVQHGKTGLLTPFEDRITFTRAVARLLQDSFLRRAMGRAAADYVRRHHDLATNYRVLEGALEEIVAHYRR